MAKPKLALIPATIGTKVYSVLPSDGDGDFAFTRATAGTRINSLGLIEEVDSGKNRLNYDLLDGKVYGCPHLLLEPARTNLLKYSESFSQSYWTKSGSSIASNNAISPDGSLNASKLVENTSNSAHRILNGSGLSVSGNVSMSVFAKKGGRNFIRLTNNNLVGAFFDLNNGVVLGVSSGISAKIENFGNDWYRCSITQTGVAAERLIVYLSNNGIDTSYQGDGTSGVYIWGAQLEAGTYATSYIESNSNSTTTRNAEVATGSGNAQTFNDSEGVLMFEGSAKNDAVSKRISISDGSFSNRISLDYTQVTNTFNLYISNKFISAVFNVETNNKLAFKYKNNDCSLFLNGFKVGVISSVTVPVGLDTLQLTDANETSSPFYGNTKQIQYFDSVLADSELEELTSWVSFQEMANGQLYTIE